MNTKIKQQWVTALRSGKYTQAVGNLQSDQGFCCLGVLCDLYSKETGTEWEVQYSCEHIPHYWFDGAASFLPESVIEWAGLDKNRIGCEDNFYDLNGDNCYDLAHLNDSGSSFIEIAKLIKKHL